MADTAAAGPAGSGAPTLFTCTNPDAGPNMHPCKRVTKAMNAAGIEYKRVMAAGGNPIPFLRKGSRDELEKETGSRKLPALKLADGTVITESRNILRWIEDRK